MQIHALHLRSFAFVAGVAILAFSGWAAADPPSRVARLGYTTGPVSFSPAGESDWVEAAINRPLTSGDRLWADAGARAEIQVGGAMIRMGADTGVSILNLDDRIAQLQLTQGILNVRVRRLERDQVFEVDTPNLAFTLRQPGEYRIAVDPDGNTTDIVVRKGQGEVYGEGAAYAIDSRQPYRFAGTGLRDYEYIETPRLDEFDRWASDRDRRYDRSASARYVSPDVVGYQDLDANGTWRADTTYGNVWFPNRVASDWAPYRDGHWAWVDPWGWTWVDDAPWGFAVSHYGRWTHVRGAWGWVPGPVRTRAYYAPALVAFVGGDNFQLTISGGNVGGVAWFPLAPREVYRPSYAVSRGYFENVNRSNTVVSTTVVNNYYKNTNVTNVVYVNREVPGAVVAVPQTVFVQSQPVSRAAVRVSREMIVAAPVAYVAAVAPTEKSVHGASGHGDKPPARVFERAVVARTAPPAAHVGFAAQQQQLTAKPGKPLDDATRKTLKHAAIAPMPVVKLVEQEKKAPPTRRPPPAVAGAKAGDVRAEPDKTGKRAKGESRAQPAAPLQRAAPAAAPQVAPAAPSAKSQEQRGKPEKAEKPAKAEPRARPVAPPPQAAPAPAAAPQAAPVPAPEAAPRGRAPKPDAGKPEKADKPAKAEPRARPVAPPPQAAPAPAAAPQAAPVPAPEAAPRGRAPKPDAGKREKADKPAKAEPRAQPVAPPPQAAPAPAAAPQAAPVPAPEAAPHGKAPKPAAGKPDHKKKDGDEQKDDDEKGKRKG